MLKPICVKCARFYRPKRNGYNFTEGMPVGTGTKPGHEMADRWKPYKRWSGDLWECLGCGHELLSGVGMQPIAIQHQPDFEAKRKSFRCDQFQVNDC